MKRAMGIAVGLLLSAGAAWAHHGEGEGANVSKGQEAQKNVYCVPVQQQQQQQQMGQVQQPPQSQEQQLSAEDWQGLAEHRMGGMEPYAGPYQGTYVASRTGVPAGIPNHIRGEVARVNLSLGEVGLWSNGQFVTLRATPAQLVTLKPGRIVELDYADCGGVLRLVGPQGRIP